MLNSIGAQAKGVSNHAVYLRSKAAMEASPYVSLSVGHPHVFFFACLRRLFDCAGTC